MFLWTTLFKGLLNVVATTCQSLRYHVSLSNWLPKLLYCHLFRVQ